jgi:tRNA-modifying protein YgfZ
MTAPLPATSPLFVRQPSTVDLVADTSPTTWASWRDNATHCDRSLRRRLLFSGAKAAEVLGGLVTNDVTKLEVGSGQYAAALSPKGKVIADLRIMRVASELLLVDADMLCGTGLVAMIRKYVNPRLATYRDITESTCCVGVYGPHASAAMEQLLAGVTLDHRVLSAEWTPFRVETVTVDGESWWIVASPDFGVTGYDLFLPTSHKDRVASALSTLPHTSDAECEAARIVAGRPRWGVDLDDGTIPQEARLDALGAISFDKGCYTGQEVVARLHFRGHVNRRLVMLSAPAAAPLPFGAEVKSAEGNVVGDVRSSTRVPPDRCVAIAMVRREVPDGARVLVNDVEVAVEAIPRPSSS